MCAEWSRKRRLERPRPGGHDSLQGVLVTVGQVPLAEGGPGLSPIVAGTMRLAEWGLSPEARLRWIETCVDLGITSFDHADIYGGYCVEGLFGEALRLATPSFRSRLQIVTKCGIRLVSEARPDQRIKSYDSSARHVRESVERSLAALGVDVIDLLLLHRPDPLVDADELAQIVASLKREGKILHFGVSNHGVEQFSLIADRMPVVTNQIEFSPLALRALDDGTLEHCQRRRIRPMVWSPLAGGRLLFGEDPEAMRVRTVLGELANDHGLTVDTLAYAWILRHPAGCLPVTGTRDPLRLKNAVEALSVSLEREAWFRILKAARGCEVP